MIEEEYVGFETAKLLKEKGFNEPCQKIYFEDGRLTDADAFYICNITNSNIVGCRENSLCTAPSQSLVLRWLRDTYNAQVEPFKNKFGWHYTIYDLNDSDISGCKKLYEQSIFGNEAYKTYEGAAEAGIIHYITNHIS